jgi:hypothetical protein
MTRGYEKSPTMETRWEMLIALFIAVLSIILIPSG